MRRLSSEQVAAAGQLEGAVRVDAGAGTGKTAVIAERFRRLVASGVPPASILVMTFSERAAGQMRNRICEALGDSAGSLALGTFHSMCLGWLREDGGREDVPAGFQVLAGAERWILARELMWELADPELVGSEHPDQLVTPLLKVLERLKQELIPLSRLEGWCREAADDDRAGYLAAAVRLFRALAERSRQMHRLDFDDLLVAAVNLLDRNPALRRAYGLRYRHIMVDEYQDTNLAQERLVELLGPQAESVFVVGDDDQSIYRFRGASRANMERFLHSFPKARTFSLEVNRRSRRRIVGSAAALIANNSERLPKAIAAVGPAGVPVEVSAHEDGVQEAAAIASTIVQLRTAEPERQVAVLVRTNAIARPLLAALEAAGQPFELKGTLGFYERPEVKDLIAYLKLLSDPDDRVALARLMTRPPLNLGGLDAFVKIAAAAHPLSTLAAWEPCASWAQTLLELLPLVQRLGVDE